MNILLNRRLNGVPQLLSLATVMPPSPPAPTGNANRFDLVLSASAVAPGNAVTWSLIPNAPWHGGGNIVLAPSNGDAAITQAVPSSGSATLTGSYTPSAAGEIAITATNTAGLYNPYPAPLTVFTAGSGTASTITASLTRTDQARFQRDAASGNPVGFSASWAQGWGEVWFTLGQSGSALFVRLYDSLSTGATATAGTGTALTGIVQVHGAFTAGQVRALLPAGPYIYYADIATDAAFTNPVRVAQRFGVGVVVGILTRSQETNFANPYADSTAYTPVYTKLATQASGDSRYPSNGDTGGAWGLISGAAAGQEFARILEAQLGVVVGITGMATTGGGFDEYFYHDGTPSPAFQNTITASCGSKFRYLTVSMGGWSGAYPSLDSSTTETFAEDQARMQSAMAKMPQLYPSCAVIRWCSSASGWFGSDGSRDLGYTRVNGIARVVEASSPIVVSGESTLWNEFVGNHASKAAAPDYARTAARMMLSVEPAAMGGLGTTNRGPTLSATGTVVGRILRIPYTLHGGTTLTSVKAVYADPNATYSTASPAELAPLWSVYAGAGGRQGAGLAIKIASATINAGLGTVDLALFGSSGITYSDNSTGSLPSVFTVHYGADFGASASRLPDGTGASLCDDVSEFAIPYGRLMRPALDIAVS